MSLLFWSTAPVSAQSFQSDQLMLSPVNRTAPGPCPCCWLGAPWGLSTSRVLGALQMSAWLSSLSGFQCDCSWFLFLFCVFLFTLVWLYFAIIILNDFHNFNE